LDGQPLLAEDVRLEMSFAAKNGASSIAASQSQETEPSLHTLPDKPLFTLEPSRGWVPLNLRELWLYRELLFFLTLRDVQVRYKQTLLGAAWAVIQPLFTMLVFWLFFGRLAGMPSDGIPYPLFALAGLLPWTFFSNAVTNSGNSLVGSTNLVTKVYFPRMIIPGSAVLAGLVDFAIAFLSMGGMLVWYEVGISWQILLVPPLVALLVLLATGVGMWMSALNVKYRDIRYALPFLVQLWMFATPIIYPASIVPEKWRWVLALNPMSGIIEGFRSALFGRPVDWLALGLSTGAASVVFLFAALSFRRMETRLADTI
jgi:lipopolysaccharide transport system permease protein